MRKRPVHLNTLVPTYRELDDLQLIQQQIDYVQRRKNCAQQLPQHRFSCSNLVSMATSARLALKEEELGAYKMHASLSGAQWTSQPACRRFGLTTRNYASENMAQYVRVMDCQDDFTEREIGSLDMKIYCLQNILDSKDVQIKNMNALLSCLDEQIAVRQGKKDAD